MKTKIIFGLFVFISIFIGFVLLSSKTNPYQKQNVDARLELGLNLYQQNCASCHGNNLEGKNNWQSKKINEVYPSPPHDETGHTWHHSDDFLFNYTKYGGQKILERMNMKDFQSGMPGFEFSLTDDEIWNILNYIKSTWPEKIQRIQANRK